MMKRLIEGHAYPRDFQRELNLFRGTVKYHLGRFLQYGIAKRLEDEKYAFINYAKGEELVIEAVKLWESLAFRCPTVEEIADETGIVPEEAKILVYKTKSKTGWFMPNEGIIVRARERLGEILVCAARIRDLCLSQVKESFWYDEDVEIVKDAERFLEEHPEMLPKLTEGREDVASWPSEALKYLGKGYVCQQQPLLS